MFELLIKFPIGFLTVYIVFPNNSHIVSSENISYRQMELAPSEPILAPEFYWEFPRTNLYGSVLKTPKGYEMFYQCANAIRVAYAFSEDGLVWQKPLINETNWAASGHDIVLSPSAGKMRPCDEALDESNRDLDTLNRNMEEEERVAVTDQADSAAENKPQIEMTNLVAGYHMPTVMYVEGDERPYKMFAFGEHGYDTLSSVDGTDFERLGSRIELVDGSERESAISIKSYHNEYTDKTWCSDVAPCFINGEKFTAMTKTYHVDENRLTRRCIGTSSSEDFLNWDEMKTVWVPGDAEDAIAKGRGYKWADFYGLCPFPYGDGYLGYLWLFEIEKELPNGTNLGKIEVFLAYSTDCNKWQRIEEKPFIPWDLNFGQDGGMVTTASAPIFEKNEIKVYYSDSNYEHGYAEKDFTKKIEEPTWVVRCAQLPKERLVGAYSEKGVFCLSEVAFKGKKIRLNLDCKEGRVVLDYLVKDKIVGSQIIETINETDYLIEPVFNGMVQLRFGLENAIVYAVEVLD
jgi:hypothetical protein